MLFHKEEIKRLKGLSDARCRISVKTYPEIDSDLTQYGTELVELAYLFSNGKTIQNNDILDAARVVHKKRVVTDYEPRSKRVKKAKEESD